jgi:hypothetical protein
MNFTKNNNSNNNKIPYQNFIDGSILTRDWFIDQFPFILFLTFIAVIYIGNRYHAEKIVRKTAKLQIEIKELRAESITSASKLMYISKQSEVARLVKSKGLKLKEAVKPPYKLVVSDNE